MKIKLLPSNAEQVAEEILRGDRPPETSDYEVIKHLLTKCKEKGIELSFYRLNKDKVFDIPNEALEDAVDSSVDIRPLEISMQEMQIACDRDIELRPLD